MRCETYSVRLETGEKRFSEVQWKCNETLTRLGLLQILRSNEAANAETIAETLALNTARLHDYQNSFQQILVIATGLVFPLLTCLILNLKHAML